MWPRCGVLEHHAVCRSGGTACDATEFLLAVQGPTCHRPQAIALPFVVAQTASTSLRRAETGGPKRGTAGDATRKRHARALQKSIGSVNRLTSWKSQSKLAASIARGLVLRPETYRVSVNQVTA
jgi:hypothetical protein